MRPLAVIVVRCPAYTSARPVTSPMDCPNCQSRLIRWGYARERTVRSPGDSIHRVRPARMRCTGCARTHVLLASGLIPRRADSVEVIGTALRHKAQGHGFRWIAQTMGRAESTVRRWLRRATDSHLQWAWQRGCARLIILNAEAFTELRFSPANHAGNALLVLAAAAYWDSARCGFTDGAWAMIGMYTRGSLLAPPPG